MAFQEDVNKKSSQFPENALDISKPVIIFQEEEREPVAILGYPSKAGHARSAIMTTTDARNQRMVGRSPMVSVDSSNPLLS